MSNVLKIACLGSDLTMFTSQSWITAKEYDFKILSDLGRGLKSWENLEKCIDAGAWAYAKELTAPKSKPNASTKPNPNNQKICTTFNSFRKEGCSWEHNNPGEKCVFLHACSNCKARGHKAIYCPKDFTSKTSTNTASAQAVSPAVAAPTSTAVTSG